VPFPQKTWLKMITGPALDLIKYGLLSVIKTAEKLAESE
jgi:hypothetical protein